MKRLFAYDMYYPKGGSRDAIGSFDTLDEIKIENFYDYYEVLDLEKREWITLR